MLHAPTSEKQTGAEASRTQSEPEMEQYRQVDLLGWGWPASQRLLGTGELVHPPVDRRRGQMAKMQQTYGNQAVLRMMGRSQPTAAPIQMKLTVNQPGDEYEQEADQIADQVMRMPKPKIQRLCPECKEELQRQPMAEEKKKEEETLQMKPLAESITPLIQRQTNSPEEEKKKEEEILQTIPASGEAVTVSPTLQSQITALQGGGQPLPESERHFFELRFETDFSQVRVHADGQAAKVARAVNARAFTLGRNVVFGAGQYQPQLTEGQRLLAHELTHVVQQNSSLHPHPNIVQRKLVLYSQKDAQAFKWFLTDVDAKNYQYSIQSDKPLTVTVKNQQPERVDDPFRFNILKVIIGHTSETLLIRGIELSTPTPIHNLYRNGRESMQGKTTPLGRMTNSILGAGGLMVPSVNLALSSDQKYTGPVSPIPNESWILYANPASLAHEFAHAFLLFSGTVSAHGEKIPKAADIKEPGGKVFEGNVDFFIEEFVDERISDRFDPEALHFSPTAIRKWPEPPYFNLTFTGTWLEFLAKYPGATAKQKIGGEGKNAKRQLEICVPKKGELCPP